MHLPKKLPSHQVRPAVPSKAEPAIIKALSKATEPMTPKEICEKSGMSKGAINTILERLVHRKTIAKVGALPYRDPRGSCASLYALSESAM